MAANIPHEFFLRRKRRDGIWSMVIAVGLNLGLFLIMPALIDSKPEKPAFDTVIPGISLTRIRKPEIEKPPEPVKPPEPKVIERPAPTASPLPSPKLSLPFEINPQLPSAPTTLNLPPVETTLATGPSQGDLFSVGQLDAPLTVLVQMAPLYPLRARQRNIEGWVKVRFVVDEQGNANQITVLAAKPAGVFEQSVQRCVSNWRFKPGTIGGVAVKSLVEQTITFKLE